MCMKINLTNMFQENLWKAVFLGTCQEIQGHVSIVGDTVTAKTPASVDRGEKKPLPFLLFVFFT